MNQNVISHLSGSLMGKKGWLSGRAPDSWLEGHGFKSWQENLLQGQLSVPSYSGICFTPMLLQGHMKDPGHSAKSAGGKLQLNTHAPFLCGFELDDTVNHCMVYLEHVLR